jgi:adenylosuccinate lyase
MIDRYSVPELTAIWSDDHKFQTWLKVEIAVAEAWGDEGVIPPDDVAAIRDHARVHTPDVIRYIEETHHDVTAFLRAVADSLGDESRWVHYGLTSNDVWDTATCLQLVDAIDFLARQLRELRAVVTERAIEHRKTICIGRTHGVHAEPTTFGLKLAVWVDELRRHEERLALARKQLAVGQMSGPVGSHASVPPSVEANACRRLGLEVAPITTQIIQRDRHAFFLGVVAGIGASLEKFATEIRALQRTEIREAEEPFAEGAQTGSSSMPHKRNPELCERVCGLARTLRGYATVGLENVTLWHERDISHSSAERIAFPDATGLLAYSLQLFTGVMRGLVVYPDRMRANVDRTRGLVFSARVLNALLAAGMRRDAAYKIVQSHAMHAWHEDLDFRSLLEADPEVTARLLPAQLDELFDVNQYLLHIDDSFARLGLVEATA